MKFVMDTVYSVTEGPSEAITRQPSEGKNTKGGLRLGEMEIDVLSVHGSMRFLHNKINQHSDGFVEYICRRCHQAGIYNSRGQIFTCPLCKDKADLYAIQTSYAAHTFIQELRTMGIEVLRRLEPHKFERLDPPETRLIEGSETSERSNKSKLTKTDSQKNFEKTIKKGKKSVSIKK